MVNHMNSHQHTPGGNAAEGSDLPEGHEGGLFPEGSAGPDNERAHQKNPSLKFFGGQYSELDNTQMVRVEPISFRKRGVITVEARIPVGYNNPDGE